MTEPAINDIAMRTFQTKIKQVHEKDTTNVNALTKKTKNKKQNKNIQTMSSKIIQQSFVLHQVSS